MKTIRMVMVAVSMAAMLQLPLDAAEPDRRDGGKASTRNREVLYAKPASWVRPAPEVSTAEIPASASVHLLYFDQQIRRSKEGTAFYSAQKMRILKPEALAVGNLQLVWNPSAGTATVHHVRIVRAGQAIDVLANNHFSVIQREDGLEAARITGNLTAAMQVPGLRVGDELEFAVTIAGQEPALEDKAYGWFQLPIEGANGTFRSSVMWPKALPLQWKSSGDLGALAPFSLANDQVLSVEMRDPKPALIPDNAPDRFRAARRIQFSDFADWTELSQRFYPLYQRAANVPNGSPIWNEIARIRNLSADPAERARLALKLVQDDVRYVFVGLNGGNFQPMLADTVWRDRLGDCKAKTALMLALLNGLGIPAEAVLVNSNGGDGTDDDLPSPLAFDHVVVRATIAGKTYWLDGTRTGEGLLESDQPWAFQWALPLRAVGAPLESVSARVPSNPLIADVVTLDVRTPDKKKAKVSFDRYLRGDAAFGIRAALAGMSVDAAENALRKYWKDAAGWIDLDAASWKFDESHKILHLKAVGVDDTAVDTGDGSEFYLDVPGAGFTPPDEMKRPTVQDANIPWKVTFPRSSCWFTNVLLPPLQTGRTWKIKGAPADTFLAGTRRYRRVELSDNIVRSVMVIRSEVREVNAESAQRLNQALPTFDNAITRISRQTGIIERRNHSPDAKTAQLPLVNEVDWFSNNTPCNLPPRNHP